VFLVFHQFGQFLFEARVLRIRFVYQAQQRLLLLFAQLDVRLRARQVLQQQIVLLGQLVESVLAQLHVLAVTAAQSLDQSDQIFVTLHELLLDGFVLLDQHLGKPGFLPKLMSPGLELCLERPILELQLIDHHGKFVVIDNELFLIILVVVFEHKLRIELRDIRISVNELHLAFESQNNPLILAAI
jgi:hypothetical protein